MVTRSPSDTALRRSTTASAPYDLIILGAGSAGFAAAITAARAGSRVALVEPGQLGGTCVNVGCVPSKALLAASDVAWTVRNHTVDGVPRAIGPVDIAPIAASAVRLADTLRQAKYADLVDEYGLEVIQGAGRFIDPQTLAVSDRRLRSSAFMIATGASPKVPAVPGLAEAGYLTSTTAMGLTELPQSVTVLGAGAVGLELGQYFLNVGSSVTFLEIADRIAPQEEPEVSASLAAALQERGATILTGAGLAAVRRLADRRVLDVRVGDTFSEITTDEVLVATGRSANSAGLGLDAAQVGTDEHGAIIVDSQLRTTNPRIWAIGDVIGGPQFVYTSAYHGTLAVENALLGQARTVDYSGLPRVIFTSPQVAAVGLTEEQARRELSSVSVAVIPISTVPWTQVSGDHHGVIKLVADPDTDQLLGAAVVGPGAANALQSAVLAIRHGITVTELAATFHPYLTMAEGLKLAAQAFRTDVQRLSCCAA